MQRERIASGAGELLRHLLDSFGLGIVPAWDNARHTYFGNFSGSSLIDYLAIPLPLIPGTLSAGPLLKLGRRMQLINRRTVADHLPVHASFYYLLQHPGQHENDSSPQALLLDGVFLSEVEWCRDALMRGLREGEKRIEFIELLEKEMESMLASSQDLLQQNTPDDIFMRLDSTIIKVGLQIYGKRAPVDDENLAALKAKRLALLAERRDLRGASLDASPEDFDRNKIELDKLTKSCRKLTKKARLRRSHLLVEELWDNWRKRRMAECHRLLQDINATLSTQQHRGYTTLRTSLPTMQQWEEVLG